MRVILAACATALFVAGCAPAPAPNDQNQYFDNINPDPARLGTTSQPGQTVQLPGDQPASTAPVVGTENAEISNTQDFHAVKAKESIASDAAKLAALKENYEVVQPEALPTRGGEVNLAAYAISQKQAVGTRTYRRANTGGSNCGRYRKDPDGAQRAFLNAGGPVKDRNRLDSDGDGFACTWNPNVYRRLVQN